MTSNCKQIIEKVLGRRLTNKEWNKHYANLTVKNAIEKAKGEKTQ